MNTRDKIGLILIAIPMLVFIIRIIQNVYATDGFMPILASALILPFFVGIMLLLTGNDNEQNPSG